jgi:Chaperone of endosialidase
MASDIKLLDGDQVLVEGADLVVDRVQPAGQQPSSVSLNLKNPTGFWHISGPRTYEAGNPLCIFWNDNSQWSDAYLTINTAGNVGIGTPDPGYKLDITGRMRVKQANDTAGIWFYQSEPAKDQAFVGMAGDTQVGFWGNTGAGWGLVMNTTTGNVGIGQANPVRRLHVEGSEIHSAGSKAGFSFSDRKVKSFVEEPSKGERWVWYCHGGTARLRSGVDRLSVSSNGFVSISYGLEVLGSPGRVSIPGTGQIPGSDVIEPTYLITAKPDTGNVGIGTPDPGYKLDIIGRMRVRQKADNTAGIWFYQTKPDKNQAFVGMSTDTQVGFWGNTGANWGLVMDTTTGNVGIGTGQATPSQKLHVVGDALVTNTLTATAVKQTSSRVLKENIAELSLQEAISALTNLNPVKFNFKADSNKESHVGFIAEDVPELVAMADRKTLSSMDIVAVLTKVVQEQHQQISQLVTEVNALKQAQANA